jgi:hypothetical protein
MNDMSGERPPWVSATQNFELAQVALVQMREHSNPNLIVGNALNAQVTTRRFDIKSCMLRVCHACVSCVSVHQLSWTICRWTNC